MKITLKIKKQINELAIILHYAIEWAEDIDEPINHYRTGAIECAAFIVSCKIVQEILIPNKTMLDCLGTGEVVDITNLFKNPSLNLLKDSLTDFLIGVE